MALDANRIINGTFGEVWLDGDKVSECYGLEARVEIDKEDIAVCGKLGTDTKMMGYKGTGSLKLHKVNSRMMIKLSDQIKAGINPRVQILSSLKDPAAYGAERILIKDAVFDDLTLASWEAKAKGEIECPFTFTDWELLDTIAPKEA
ncbi:phage tail tube protein [Thermosyntropha sp.]|uniref:phage tail tube protein n=1 Tax=Thermosyntropha sp. TaxID=2740820 RepID=UPI0025EE8D5A|nr:phage tail tube protein [Thermosyntropha sp.]MBO8158828.1 phage tail tube protein [Thermosyntropha sp.]